MKNRFLQKPVNYYRNLSIKNKLLLLFYIQIIVPLFFIGYMSYYKSAETIRVKSIKYSQDLLKMMELRYRDLSENLNVLSMELLYDNRIHDVLKKDGTEETSLERYRNTNEIRNVLREATLSRSEVQSISIVSNKHVVYSFDANSTSATVDHITSDQQTVNRIRKGRGKAVWIVNQNDNQSQNIFVTRMIYNRDTYQEIGMIAILLKKEFFESVYRELSNETSQNITILSENNVKILGDDLSNTDIVKGLLEHKVSGSNGYYIDKNKSMLVSSVTLDNPNWKIVYHVTLADLYKEINSLRFWICLVVIISLLILSTISILSSLDIVNPIHVLIEGIKRFEKSKKHEKINLNRNDEIGYMANAFNNMSERIDVLVNRVYTEELTRKEAEIMALQAQINPHFLFNTLESINWMAQLRGAPEISEIVTSLSTILDANIGRDTKLVTLAEEFNYIDNYINILRSRYGDKLSVEKCIDQNLMNIMIPRLSIQPLVENSVYHGIEKITERGIIRLNIYATSENVFIEIIDNGPGIETDELNKLNDLLCSVDSLFISDNGVKKRKSIGIENVNRRIKLFYGSDYGLSMESKAGEYMKVIVKLPKRIVNEGEFHNV